VVNPAWEGTVQFYELVFGTWLAYGFLTLMWERALGCRLAEWKYVLITFLGASAFWINHYFQNAPFWIWLLNAYAAAFLISYYFIAVRGQPRSKTWQVVATLSAVVFTVAYIAFENISRFTVNNFGISEFWFMLIAFFGFVAVILWRGCMEPRQSKHNNQIDR
jgi:hypothetical protein